VPAIDSPPAPRIAGAEALDEAVTLLTGGGIVAVPTETVYGLAARADSDAAVAQIYRAKGRPAFNPLIVHVEDCGAASLLTELDRRAEALADCFWPGPLTMVLPRREDATIAPAVSAGLPTLAVRSPAHPLMRELLARAGLPLAAPSANRSGAISPTTAAHVAKSLGAAVPLVLDGGTCQQGLESTIIALRRDGTWAVLRPGPITKAQLAKVLGSCPQAVAAGSSVEAPGQLTSHYAPAKPLRLGAEKVEPDEYLIGFGAIAGNDSLSPEGDLFEAAARLYACLHTADAASPSRIAVARIPEEGIGAAINDRLRRAAA
jgi:L-threonylcarbamoyladenylate synthase